MTTDQRGELDALRDDLLVVLHQAAEVRDAFTASDTAQASDAFEVLHLAITATAARVRSVARPEVDACDPAAIVHHALQSWGRAPSTGMVGRGACRVSMPGSLLRQMLEDLNRQAKSRRFPLVVTLDTNGGAQPHVVITASEAPSCSRIVVPHATQLDWLSLATDLVRAHGGALARFVDPGSGARRTTVALPTLLVPPVVVAG